MPSRRTLPSPLGLLAAGLLFVAGARAAGAAELSEAARWLQGYVRLDTTNPPGDEVRGAAFLARILHREGIPTRLLFTADGRASLYARLEGERDGGGLLLVHHIDVVAPGPGWTVDPFAGEVRAGALWGRGAVDVKSLGVAHLAAFLDLKRSGARLTRDVALLAVADEENGGLEGTAWLLDHHPELFEGIGAVLNEGGANRAISGRILWWGVERAQKRPLWLRVTAGGRGGHGSGLNPHSASHRLIRALADLLALPPTYRVTQAARDYLGALAPYEPPGSRRVFADLDAYIAPDGPRGPLMPGVANLFLDTVQVTVLDAGQRINVIPDEASALIDVRMLPDTDGEGMLAVIRRALGDRVRCEVVLTSPPAPPSPVDTELFETVRRVLGPEAQVVPAFIPGFTDSRYFRARGITTYGLSPFALESDALHGIHGPDERIPLDELDRGVERFRRLVRSFVTGPPEE
jgi:acetylornithine deacetylase/succinyl-diaminopimelate desuccinylase-like protein